jgi:hypothetical protein
LIRREKMKAKPISSYFDADLNAMVKVYATKKARKDERTFQNRMGSVFSMGAKANTLRGLGLNVRMGQ